ncbi:MAG: hypothetical protein HWE15_04920 [Algoriphagus sp.]|uniref:hypothetical protein n=1 Tax=Algoriphagus sp. TaxID=1872435 RepID=UPI0017A4A95A|nr:hypothetical protein [Algoriphagus sp.]NVJ85624.1 hypothetical protein [Algoriphagus sp.]
MLAELKTMILKVMIGLTFLLLIIGFSSCEDEEPQRPEMAIHYFPIMRNNSWNYEVNMVKDNGEVTSTHHETWTVGDGRIDKESDSPHFGGYWIMYIGGDTNIYNVVGEFLTTRYIKEKPSEWFLLYHREDNIPAWHWIMGGKKVINGQEYLIAKDSLAYDLSQSRVRIYTFQKGVGISEKRELFYTIDQNGVVTKSDSDRVHTLTGYQLR